MGAAAARIVPALVPALDDTGAGAAGEVAPGARAFMRGSVLLGDALVFVPAALAYVSAVSARGGGGGGGGGDSDHHSLVWARALAPLLLLPALVAVDHGHFQYNSVSLGLALAGAALLLMRRELAAAAAFAAALNYKQMLLFFAPVFFVWLLGVACAEGLGGLLRLPAAATRSRGGARAAPRRAAPSAASAAAAVAAIGGVVVAVFAALWAPFCLAATDADGGCAGGLAAVLHRQFPLARNVFEDKVGSIWCAAEPVLGLRALVLREPAAAPRVAAMCALAVAALMAPALAVLWRTARHAHAHARSAPQQLCLALLGVSTAFFLAGYQVHEKSVLMPALAAAACWAAGRARGGAGGASPLLPAVVSALATWSLWPLLLRDGQLPRAALTWLFCALLTGFDGGGGGGGGLAALHAAALADARLVSRAVGGRVPPAQTARALLGCAAAVAAAACAVSLAAASVAPPRALPDLFPYLTAVVTCGGLLLTQAWALALQAGLQAADAAGAKAA